MKTLKLILITLATSLLFITGCGEKEITNPFDEGCPKELFTPSDFKAAMEGNAVKLTWTQENTQISGFVVTRSENDGAYSEVARVAKTSTNWTDTKVLGGTKYGYQLNAYAGENMSNQLQAMLTTPALGATVTTVSVASDITAASATLGGNVTDDGGATVSERGICFATTTNPTTASSKTIMGNGKGVFSGTITGLAANTTYYAKAYATNSYGTAYGSEISFKTTQLLLATVTTANASSITTTSAILGGNVTGDGGATVTERGVCYSTSQNPTITNSILAMGNGTGVFSNTVNGLTFGTTYYARSYATNSQGTAYGVQVTFTTTPVSIATVTTSSAATVTAISAVLGGNVSNDGGATVTERGVCYSTSQNPTTSNSKLAIGTGTGTFTNTVTGLIEGTTYYVRAYAINSQGTAYGTQINFTTSQHSLATVTTADATNITGTTVVLGGNVTNDGNATVTERGVCYAITENPTTGNTKLAIGNGTGAFSNTASGLTGNTTYYARAYAINSKGTAYGNQVSFKTEVEINLASLSTTAASGITINSAVVGGNVTDDGGGSVTERGICYSFSTADPSITDSPKVAIGSGLGLFSTTITGLAANTTYYVKAYAKNSAGISYGVMIYFVTPGNIPTVSTKNITNILETSAVAGGVVLTDEGSAITQRGVCYSITANPTIYDDKIESGSGLGGFNIALNTLIPNMTYYVRAYATNSNGTAYGENKSFKTLDAYYAGFENGLPPGWTGTWSVSSDTPYEGFYCLKSTNADQTVEFTKNITNASGGQISFFHQSEGGCDWMGYNCTDITTEFYIDNVLQAAIKDEGWTQKSFSVSTGTHVFKWINKGGGYSGRATYIDYVIAPK